MTIGFDPKNEECFDFGVSNGCWFELLKCNPSMAVVLDVRNLTSDPIDANEEQAVRCAEILKSWTPRAGWYQSGQEHEGLWMFVEFFESCGGFTTF